MEESRKKIIKFAKILRVFAIGVVIAMSISVLVVIGVMVAYLIGDDLVSIGELKNFLSSEGSTSLLDGFDLLEEANITAVLIILVLIRSLIRGVIVWYAVVFEKILHKHKY